MPRIASPLVLLALALAACSESQAERPPPLDKFYFPAGVALAPRTGLPPALVVASSDFDLRFGPKDGGTVISVDSAASLGAPDGALTVLGATTFGPYGGPLAIATPAECPGLAAPVAMVASRLDKTLTYLPLRDDGGLAPCPAQGCTVPLQAMLASPYAVGVACRADGLRNTAFVSYLATPRFGNFPAGTAWLTAVDLDDPFSGTGDIALGYGPISGMAYDLKNDRLLAVGRFIGLSAPLYVLGLGTCQLSQASCAAPTVTSTDLFSQLRGADLQGIALSNDQAGFGRRAYVTARVYDADLALRLGGRPPGDVGSALLVLDIEDDTTGHPTARVLRVVDVGLGVGDVKVLPVRPGQRDLVVATSVYAGTVTVYDDELGAVVSVIALDPKLGTPLAGREPFALAVQDDGTGTAQVWIASFEDSMVSRLDVPLAQPGLSRLAAGSNGQPLRIGR
jgi:hypothetical protein